MLGCLGCLLRCLLLAAAVVLDELVCMLSESEPGECYVACLSSREVGRVLETSTSTYRAADAAVRMC